MNNIYFTTLHQFLTIYLKEWKNILIEYYNRLNISNNLKVQVKVNLKPPNNTFLNLGNAF